MDSPTSHPPSSTGASQETGNASLAMRPATLLLVLITSISPLAMHIYLPLLPELTQELGASDAQVQLTLSVYLFAVAAAQLIIGPLSDRYGRRPVLLIGIIIFLISTLACRFATSIEALIVARGLQAIGGCTGIVLARAIVRDVSAKNEAASLLGYVTMGMAVAQMMGPAIGGFLGGFYGWRASFDILFVLGLLVLAAVTMRLRETNLQPQPSLSPRLLAHNHMTLLRQPRFWAFALTGAAASGVFFAFLGGGPILSQRVLGLSPVEYGLYFTLIAAGYAAGNYVSGRFSARLGPPVMILSGNTLGLLAMLLMAALWAIPLVHPMSLFGPMLITSVANGLTMPNSLASALSVKPELAGTASGIAGSIQLAVGAFATVLVGWFIGAGAWPLIIIMLIFAVLALIIGLAASQMERARASLVHPQ